MFLAIQQYGALISNNGFVNFLPHSCDRHNTYRADMSLHELQAAFVLNVKISKYQTYQSYQWYILFTLTACIDSFCAMVLKWFKILILVRKQDKWIEFESQIIYTQTIILNEYIYNFYLSLKCLKYVIFNYAMIFIFFL